MHLPSDMISRDAIRNPEIYNLISLAFFVRSKLGAKSWQI